MKVSVYNVKGEVVREEELDPRVFGVKSDPTFLHSVLTSVQANRRRATANTKTRAEVRGGGKKPWKQKHTGRARHGSTRSPIWKGGGVTFGPRSNRNYTEKINHKVMKKAMRMCLSAKAGEGTLFLVDAFTTLSPKTKTIATLLSALHIPLTKKHVAMLVAHEKTSALVHAARNIDSLVTMGKENVRIL